MQDLGEIVNDLNTRQWRLYDFLKQQDKPLTRNEIMEQSKLYEEAVRHTGKSYMSGGRLLTADLQAIKRSERITKVLITSREGVMLAQTKEQAEDYFKKERNEVLKRLVRLLKQENQLAHNGQRLITFGDEEDVYIALNVKVNKNE